MRLANLVAMKGVSSFAVDDSVLTTDKQIKGLCRELKKADVIAFDTEFVSENTYRPLLCLLQVATRERAVAIDPLAGCDLAPFWKVLTEGSHETIVHAGREEIRFCLAAVDRSPRELFDVQLAAGFVGLEYPAGYGNLIHRVLSRQMKKSETRTDWQRRPLSKQQIKYALDDVRYLLPLRDELASRLKRMKRQDWLQEETADWIAEVEAAENREKWRNVSGSGNLRGRALAVLRELWRWREEEARKRNQPAKRVLRDDLMVELARRQVTDPKRISAVRGMDRPKWKKIIPQLAAAVQQGLDVPDEDWPRNRRREAPPQLTMLGQFLAAAVSSICREAEVAPSLVGNPTDVRDLIVYRLGGGGQQGEQPPQLCRGWRAKLVGDLLADLLAGRVTIRIRDPESEKPLAFERAAATTSKRSSKKGARPQGKRAKKSKKRTRPKRK